MGWRARALTGCRANDGVFAGGALPRASRDSKASAPSWRWRVAELVFVGTSDAFGAGGRRQSAILVRGSSGSVLLDCGATTGGGLDAPRDRDRRDRRDPGLALPRRSLRRHPAAAARGALRGRAQATAARSRARPASRPACAPGQRDGPRARRPRVGVPGRFEELPAGRRCALGPVQVQTFETHHNPDATPHGMVLETGGPRDRLLRRHRLVRRAAALRRGQRPVHLRVHLTPRRLRVSPDPREARSRTAPSSTAAASC